TNNIQLFHKCNGEMANIFFAFDGHNYSRYLTWLEVYLTNLENTHPGAKDLLSKGAIAVARSMIPGAISAVARPWRKRSCPLPNHQVASLDYTASLGHTRGGVEQPPHGHSFIKRPSLDGGPHQRPRRRGNIGSWRRQRQGQALLPGFWCSCPHGGRDGRATSRNCGQGC
ncbi:Protein FAM149B1, partial [Dissostichus eleginoides]